VTHLR